MFPDRPRAIQYLVIDCPGLLPQCIEPLPCFLIQDAVIEQDGRFHVRARSVRIGKRISRRVRRTQNDGIAADPHLRMEPVESRDLNAEVHQPLDLGRIACSAEQIADDPGLIASLVLRDPGTFGRPLAPIRDRRHHVAASAQDIRDLVLNVGARQKTHGFLHVVTNGVRHHKYAPGL